MGLLNLFSGGRPEDRFAKTVEAELKRSAPRLPCRYDAASFTLHLGEAPRTEAAALADLYRDYQACPRGEQAQLLREFAAAVLRGDRHGLSFETARTLVKPAVRNRVLLQHTQSGDDPSALDWRPLPGPLGLGLVIDHPLGLTFIDKARLRAWGVDFETVLGAAMANLRADSPPKFKRLDGGFYASDYVDQLDGSRLLLPELFAGLELKGDPVAMVVSANGFSLCGADDEAALTAMAQFALYCFEGAVPPITCAPLVLRDGQWRALPVDPARQPELARMLTIEAIRMTEAQEAPLAEALARKSDDVGIAPLDARDVGDRPQTFTTLGEGEALLPRAEVVVVDAPDGNGARVRRWEDVEAVLGPLPEHPDVFPARYRVRPPTADEFARLRDQFPCPPDWDGFEADLGAVNIVRTRARR